MVPVLVLEVGDDVVEVEEVEDVIFDVLVREAELVEVLGVDDVTSDEEDEEVVIDAVVVVGAVYVTDAARLFCFFFGGARPSTWAFRIRSEAVSRNRVLCISYEFSPAPL